jgi:hypothetical protein
MANKDRGGREARKPKKDAKVKPVTLTSAVRPAAGPPAGPPTDAPKDAKSG